MADRVGDLRTVLRERFGEMVRLKPIPTERSLLRRRFGLGGRSDRLAESLVGQVMAVLDEQLAWRRFGL